MVVLAINALLALASYAVLGDMLGWQAPGRKAAGNLLGYIIPAAQFIGVASLLSNLLWALASRNDVSGRARIPPLAVQIASFATYAVMIAATINLVFEQSLGAILGASGIVGLVLGFALRGLVADVFSGIALQIDPSIKPGEWLDFNHRGRNMSGKLVDVTWRTVILADRSRNLILIPNGEFASMMVINRSRPASHSRYDVFIDIGAEHDEARIVPILQNALERSVAEGIVVDKPRPFVRIAAVKEGIASYRLLYYIDMANTAPNKARHTVFSFALHFLKAAGIPVTQMRRMEISRPSAADRIGADRLDARLATLASVRFLSILSSVDLATVASEIGVHRFSGGHRLLTAGEPGDSMFVVSEGSLDVAIDAPEGSGKSKLLAVARLWPGDCLGEMSLFTGAPRSAHITAREPSVVFEVRKSTMAEIFERNPALVQRIAEMIDSRQKLNADALDRSASANNESNQPVSALDSILRFFQLGSGRAAKR